MSLGHAMFFAAGMYGAGLTVHHLGFGVAAGFLAGAVAGLAVAGLVGLLTLRTTGPAFLIVTMMLAQAFYLATLYWNEVTGGDQGFILAGLHVELGGLRLALASPAVKYNVALAVFAACLLASLWIARSPVGRVLVAVRENEERTRLLGYDTARYRLAATVVSGLLAAVAGSAYTLLFSYVGSAFAGILYSIYPLIWTLLGGAGTVLGPLVGTLVMTYVVDVTSGYTTAYLLVVGAALVVMVLWAPAGIVGGIRARWAAWLP
jgi:branched-chain amino acid transport system permease protein